MIIKDKKKAAKTALRWLLMNVGALMMAASVYFFQAQNNFTLGGMGGMSIVIADYTKGILTQAQLIMIINAALLLVGFLLLGRRSMIRTVWCSLAYTGEIYIFETFVPMSGPLTDQPFLELIYSILLMGIGGALVFNCGSSTGGTDIIALILKKYTKINVGTALFFADFAVTCVSFFTFDVTTTLYSLLGLFAKSFLMDGVIENLGKTKCITIITTKPETIAHYILDVINHGYTTYDAEGGYTGEPKKVLVTICKRSEALKIKEEIKKVDPESFVIITDANEILGKGFGGTF